MSYLIDKNTDIDLVMEKMTSEKERKSRLLKRDKQIYDWFTEDNKPFIFTGSLNRIKNLKTLLEIK